MAIVKLKHKGLSEIFDTGRSAKIGSQYHEKVLMILDFLNAIGNITDCQGQFEFHSLKGKRKKEYAMSVSGNYRITFEWQDGNVHNVNYEDYH